MSDSEPLDGVAIYTDGSSLMNPGAAGVGVVIQRLDVTLETISEPLHELTTNSVAEYQALILGLTRGRALGAVNARVYSDSEFMVRQINGLSQVDAAHLLPYYEKSRSLLGDFTLEWIPRAKNQTANALAVKAAKRVITEECSACHGFGQFWKGIRS